MRRFIIAALVIGTTLFATTSQLWAEEAPQDQPLNRREGVYGELNAGTNLLYYGVFTSEAEASSGGMYGFAWNAALGYSFSGSTALEAGFMQNYAKYEDEDLNEDVSTHTNIYYLAYRGSVPLGQRAAIFAKLGLMLFTIPDIPQRNYIMLPYVGCGLRYAITPKVDISVQYQGAVYIIAGAGAFTGGITYHF